MSLLAVFPGQGSQAVGMLAALAAADPIVEQTFEEASNVVGYDLWALAGTGPEQALARTEVTQPLMLTAGIAAWRYWLNAGGEQPSFVAGHSLGEYTALVCAGALEFTATVGLVADRARFMQEAVPQGEGAMAAIIGLDDAEVTAACVQAAGQAQVVACANFNAPSQIVIAGHADAVSRAIELAKQSGAKRAILLPVSGPFHCELMRPAAERLAARLADVVISAPTLPVLHNVDARTRDDPVEIAAALVTQVYTPVAWTAIVRAAAAAGVDRVHEYGPGKVLGGLCKRIDRNLSCASISDPEGARSAMEK